MLLVQLFGLSRAVKVLVGIAVGLLLFFIGFGFAQTWGADQWGDLATWVAGVATTAAVFAAVDGTRKANRQARRAEERADRDIERRRADDERAREYVAVTTVLKSLESIVTSVHEFYRSIENEDTVQGIVGNSTDMDDSRKWELMLEQNSRIQDRLNALGRTANGALVDTQLALTQINNWSLYEASANILGQMTATTNCFSSHDGDRLQSDWGAAVEEADKLNRLGLALQEAATVRFRHADDNIPSPEAPTKVPTPSAH